MSSSVRVSPSRGRHLASRRRQAGVTLGLVVVGALTTACQARTSVPGLNVRSEPNTASEVVEEIDESGTRVVLDCVTTGESIHGDTVWYRITSPADGYVTNYYVRTNSTVLEDTPRC